MIHQASVLTLMTMQIHVQSTKEISNDHLECDNCSEKYDAKRLKLTKRQYTILKNTELPWNCSRKQCTALYS